MSSTSRLPRTTRSGVTAAALYSRARTFGGGFVRDDSFGRPPILTPVANPLLSVYECTYNGSVRGIRMGSAEGPRQHPPARGGLRGRGGDVRGRARDHDAGRPHRRGRAAVGHVGEGHAGPDPGRRVYGEGRPDPHLLRPPRHRQRAAAVPRGGSMKRRKESYDFSKGRRGAVVPVPWGKTRITIRIDTEVLDWFRQQVNVAGGGNYQTLIND